MKQVGKHTLLPSQQLMKSLPRGRHLLVEICALIPTPTLFLSLNPRAEKPTGLRPLLTPISMHFKFTL